MDNKEIDRKTLRLPITNVYSKGDFAIQVNIGSEKNTARLILDSGSSTLVVEPTVYDGIGDQSLQQTSLAQCVRYGMGGWYGPVVETDVELLSDGENMLLNSANVSIASVNESSGFAGADGILGLAFHQLNST